MAWLTTAAAGFRRDGPVSLKNKKSFFGGPKRGENLELDSRSHEIEKTIVVRGVRLWSRDECFCRSVCRAEC